MRLLKLPNTYFADVAYAGPTSLLTLNSGVTNWTVYLWDLGNTLDPVLLVEPQAVVARLAFRWGGLPFLRAQGFWPDGEPFPVPAEGDRLQKALATGTQRGWWPLAFAPDRASVLYAHTGQIDGSYQTHFHLRTPDGSAVHALFAAWGMFTTSSAFSPNGRLVALSNGMRIVSVWDVVDCREVIRLEQSDKTSAVEFVSDERLVVVAGRSVRLWDVPTGKTLTKFRAFRKFADALAVSADRRLFAVGSRDGLVRVWDSASGRELSEYEWPVGHVRALAFSPDGSTAAAAGFGSVAVWDLD